MEHKELLAVCRKYLGKNYYYRKVVDQIQEYTRDIGLTYDQLAAILEYWYVVKKSDPTKSGGGIGIVPHIYQEALQYWKEEKEYQENMSHITPYHEPDIEHIIAASPYITKPKKLKMFELR